MEKNWQPDIYSDVPVAYAVYKLIFAEDGRTAKDAQYVYVNQIYCEMAGVEKEELLGKRFLSSYENADPVWMTYCTKAHQEAESSATASMRRRSGTGSTSRSCRSRSRDMSHTRS